MSLVDIERPHEILQPPVQTDALTVKELLARGGRLAMDASTRDWESELGQPEEHVTEDTLHVTQEINEVVIIPGQQVLRFVGHKRGAYTRAVNKETKTMALLEPGTTTDMLEEALARKKRYAGFYEASEAFVQARNTARKLHMTKTATAEQKQSAMTAAVSALGTLSDSPEMQHFTKDQIASAIYYLEYAIENPKALYAVRGIIKKYVSCSPNIIADGDSHNPTEASTQPFLPTAWIRPRTPKEIAAMAEQYLRMGRPIPSYLTSTDRQSASRGPVHTDDAMPLALAPAEDQLLRQSAQKTLQDQLKSANNRLLAITARSSRVTDKRIPHLFANALSKVDEVFFKSKQDRQAKKAKNVHDMLVDALQQAEVSPFGDHIRIRDPEVVLALAKIHPFKANKLLKKPVAGRRRVSVDHMDDRGAMYTTKLELPGDTLLNGIRTNMYGETPRKRLFDHPYMYYGFSTVAEAAKKIGKFIARKEQ